LHTNKNQKLPCGRSFRLSWRNYSNIVHRGTCGNQTQIFTFKAGFSDPSFKDRDPQPVHEGRYSRLIGRSISGYYQIYL